MKIGQMGFEPTCAQHICFPMSGCRLRPVGRAVRARHSTPLADLQWVLMP